MCGLRERGFTLVEVIVLVVVVAIALVGVLLTFQTAVRSSADPQTRKQAIAIAEALLDEILLNAYDPLPGTGARANYDDVADYNGYATAGGIVDINGAPVPGLGAYDATVAVVTTALAGVGEAMRVTVTVTGPHGFPLALEGYRVRYVGP